MDNKKSYLIGAWKNAVILSVLGFGSSSFAETVFQTNQYGTTHGLHVKPDGTVYAWGTNASGEVGDGTTTMTTGLIQIPGLSDVVSVSGGGAAAVLSQPATYSSFAVKADGTVWSWGDNSYGKLADPTASVSRSSPAPASLLSNVRQIICGDRWAMALKADGTVWAWGYQRIFGFFGEGSNTVYLNTPTEITGWGNDVVALSSQGGGVVLALKADGTVWAAGTNRTYLCGDATALQFDTPHQVAGLSNAVGVLSTSSGSFAIKADGTVVGWGFNGSYQLGDGTTINRSSPVTVLGLSGVRQIIRSRVLGNLALTSEGKIYQWGGSASAPVELTAFGSDITSISATDIELVGVKANGDFCLMTYGWPTTTIIPTDPLKPIEIEAGKEHSMAIKPDGTLWSWGEVNDGRLGLGYVPGSQPSPVQVSTLSGATKISSGWMHSLAITNGGALSGWGYNDDMEAVGYTTMGSPFTPLPVTYDGIVQIAGGSSASYALDDAGSVWGFGFNGRYALAQPAYGNYGFTSIGISNVKKLSAGRQFGLALMANGTVSAWGKNDRGQAGDSSGVPDVQTPTTIVGLSNVVSVSAGDTHGVALTANGEVWSWGANDYGMLGDGSLTDSPTPVQVAISDVIAVEACAYQTLALKSNGEVWAWGSRVIGSTTDSWVPAHVASGMKAISSGGAYSLAVGSDGSIYSWGVGGAGQLGLGSFGTAASPTAIPPF